MVAIKGEKRLNRWNTEDFLVETILYVGFPGSSASKESACTAADPGLIPGLGRSSGAGNGYPFQYSGLENSVHGVTKELDITECLSL